MWFTLPLDVIWKHHMGERHWTLLRLVAHTFVTPFAVLFLTLLVFPDQIIPTPGQDGHPPARQAFALYGFMLLLWIFGMANLWETRQRTKAGIQWHTHDGGTPRFLPDQPVVHCLIIPLGSGLLAYGFYRLYQPVGLYLFSMAAMQFLTALDTRRERRVKAMDRRDREIDMEIKTAELEEHDHGPLDMVRIAPPPKRTRLPEQEARFEIRWQKVLKASDSQKT
jgi:hypothetical protein